MNAMERRKYERYAVGLKATLSLGGDTIPVMIFNISAGGALVAPQDPKRRFDNAPGKAIVLAIRSFGGFEGVVLRTDGEFYALQFDEDHKTIVNLVLQSVPV